MADEHASRGHHRSVWRIVQRFLRIFFIPFSLLLVTLALCACNAAGAAAPEPTDIAPQRPEATLIIAQPPAGATLPAGKITVVVNYNGPPLVAAAQATDLNQYHLHYFLDVNPAPYLGTGVPIPLGNPSIVHTDKTQVSFDDVAPGTHLLAVVLAGSDHVSPTKPIAQQINFTVK